MVRNALFCLERAWESTSEAQESLVYTKALLAYAFALAGNQAKRSELLQSLDKEAVKEGKSCFCKIYFQKSPVKKEEDRLNSYLSCHTVHVMLSYVMLCYYDNKNNYH